MTQTLMDFDAPPRFNGPDLTDADHKRKRCSKCNTSKAAGCTSTGSL